MMTPVYSSAQARAIDRHAIEVLGVPSLVLMENAARGACDVLLELGVELPGAHVLVACGRGNNGGDGLALARLLLVHGADVRCLLVDDRSRLSDDAARELAMLEAIAPKIVLDVDAIDAYDDKPDVIVDALLGTGAAGTPREPYARTVTWLNEFDGIRIALDIPTGIDGDTGRAAGVAFDADVTVTMAAMKPGLLLGDGRAFAGAVSIAHIGIPGHACPAPDCWLLESDDARALLPSIDPGRHKYQRGKVLVVGGARGMSGAPILAAEAALRTGAGLTLLALPDALGAATGRISPEIMTRLLPSGVDGAFDAEASTTLEADLASVRAIALGPGLSKSDGVARFVRTLLERVDVPVVLDADGLSTFAGAIERLVPHAGRLVITPHHGEMARLLALDSAAIAEDPIGIARDAARRSGSVVVLKGAPTIVATSDGRAWINGAGNAGMASGGTGDVLTGIVASLAAQGLEPLGAALAGVALHSMAADLAVSRTTERAMIASDIIEHLPAAYRALEAEYE